MFVPPPSALLSSDVSAPSARRCSDAPTHARRSLRRHTHFPCTPARSCLRLPPRTSSHVTTRSHSHTPAHTLQHVAFTHFVASDPSLLPPLTYSCVSACTHTLRRARQPSPLSAPAHALRLFASAPFVVRASSFHCHTHLLTCFSPHQTPILASSGLLAPPFPVLNPFVGSDSLIFDCPHDSARSTFAAARPPSRRFSTHAPTEIVGNSITVGFSHSHHLALALSVLFAPAPPRASHHLRIASAPFVARNSTLVLLSRTSSRAPTCASDSTCRPEPNLHRANHSFNEDVSSTGSGPELHFSNVLPR